MVGQDNPGFDPYRIVRQVPGLGTGDVVITTADGRYWVPANGRPPGTGQESARKGDRRLKPNPF